MKTGTKTKGSEVLKAKSKPQSKKVTFLISTMIAKEEVFKELDMFQWPHRIFVKKSCCLLSLKSSQPKFNEAKMHKDVQAESRDEAIGVDFELKEPEKPNISDIPKEEIKPVVKTKDLWSWLKPSDFTKIVKARNLSERKVFFYPVKKPKFRI
ncbi:hypothetical protein CHUAL_009714 [Chamberlinius hualienensis]